MASALGGATSWCPSRKVASFAELNTLLLAECLKDDERQVDGQPVTIGEAWELERPALLPLPARTTRAA